MVIATAGTDEKVKFVEQHGAKGVNYKTQDFSAEVSSRPQFLPRASETHIRCPYRSSP